MIPATHIAFKEWAVVVQALGTGAQTMLLRKGGIQEHRGQFRLEHPQFWLFPTRFHEAEQSVVPASRPALRALAATAPTQQVPIEYFAVVEAVQQVADRQVLGRLRHRHIWSEQVLDQRFQFGREPGIQAILVRVHRRRPAVPVPLLESYGGCKSWVELAAPITTEHLEPVLSDAAFALQREEFNEQLGCPAFTHA